jgi:hypothetical protein
MSDGRPDYATILSWTERGVTRAADLLAMSINADPFYAEQRGRKIAGQWFADLYRRFGFTPGTHLRGIHYRLVVQPAPVLLPDGKPYQNTAKCWAALLAAGANARSLGLVDPEAFVDRRAPSPLILSTSRPAPRPDLWMEEPGWMLPSIEPALDVDLSGTIPDLHVSGYDYDHADQPYLLECWVEKSTMDDILQPVCRALGMSLATFVGYPSITAIIGMLKRVAEHGKPARIFYISDFDGSGLGMPISAARQAEFWLSTYAPDADLKLTAIALTREQVEHYSLPRAPIEDSNHLKGNFEEHQGEGAVELDALEALYPGELARLVREAAEPYIDVGLPRRLTSAWLAARSATADAWEIATADERDELDELETEAEEIAERYRDELSSLADRLDAELTPIRERLEEIRRSLRR